MFFFVLPLKTYTFNLTGEWWHRQCFGYLAWVLAKDWKGWSGGLDIGRAHCGEARTSICGAKRRPVTWFCCCILYTCFFLYTFGHWHLRFQVSPKADSPTCWKPNAVQLKSLKAANAASYASAKLLTDSAALQCVARMHVSCFSVAIRWLFSLVISLFMHLLHLRYGGSENTSLRELSLQPSRYGTWCPPFSLRKVRANVSCRFVPKGKGHIFDQYDQCDVDSCQIVSKSALKHSPQNWKISSKCLVFLSKIRVSHNQRKINALHELWWQNHYRLSHCPDCVAESLGGMWLHNGASPIWGQRDQHNHGHNLHLMTTVGSARKMIGWVKR